MNNPIPSTFEILKRIAIQDGIYKEGDTEVTLQKKLAQKRHQGMKSRYMFDKNESPKNLPPPPAEFSSITIGGLRYAHSSTDLQVAKFCIDATIKNWNWIPDRDRVILRRDSEQAIDGEIFRIASALEEWRSFDRWLNDLNQQIQYPPKDEVWGLGLLTIYALRYCVSRKTYMPSTIVEATQKNWHLLNRVDRQTIQQDTIAAIATRDLGMDCDRNTWLSFNEWITEKPNRIKS
jgi:hypothetical protein